MPSDRVERQRKIRIERNQKEGRKKVRKKERKIERKIDRKRETPSVILDWFSTWYYKRVHLDDPTLSPPTYTGQRLLSTGCVSLWPVIRLLSATLPHPLGASILAAAFKINIC